MWLDFGVVKYEYTIRKFRFGNNIWVKVVWFLIN